MRKYSSANDVAEVNKISEWPLGSNRNTASFHTVLCLLWDIRDLAVQRYDLDVRHGQRQTRLGRQWRIECGATQQFRIPWRSGEFDSHLIGG
jgi:hypothetical protein